MKKLRVSYIWVKGSGGTKPITTKPKDVCNAVMGEITFVMGN